MCEVNTYKSLTLYVGCATVYYLNSPVHVTEPFSYLL